MHCKSASMITVDRELFLVASTDERGCHACLTHPTTSMFIELA
jgi:hypothetical protein